MKPRLTMASMTASLHSWSRSARARSSLLSADVAWGVVELCPYPARQRDRWFESLCSSRESDELPPWSDADAHAALAPAVEGFPPTQQFTELHEAQTFLAALSR